jgi:tetratricopeptide (TPR) repeat protein
VLVASGWNNYRSGTYNAAVEEFDAVVARTPNSNDEHLQALYGLATTWNWRSPGENRIKALANYEQLIAAAPKHDLAAWSLLAIARMKHIVPVDQNADVTETRKAYQECIDRFPDHIAAEEAFIYQQSTYIETLDPADAKLACATIESFISKKPASKFTSPAFHLLSKGYETLRLRDKQLEARIKAVEHEEQDPENPENELANSYWSLATIAEFDAGDFATARKYYQRLIDEYPVDIHKFGAKLALKRMDEMEAKLRTEAAK